MQSYSVGDSRANSPKPPKRDRETSPIPQRPQPIGNEYQANRRAEAYRRGIMYGTGLGAAGALLYPPLKKGAKYLWNKYNVGNKLYNTGSYIGNQFNKGANLVSGKIANFTHAIPPAFSNVFHGIGNYFDSFSATPTPTPSPTPLPNTNSVGH